MTTQATHPGSGGILIVDDDPDICRALMDFLEHEGYHVSAVATGKDAMSQVRQRRYEAVILDIGLPDVDGFTVLRTFQEVDPKLPVIILTAYTTPEKTIATLMHGAFAYLTKPYNRDELKATLSRAVGAKALAVRAETIEHALMASEERFRSVVESATDAIVLADHDGLIVSWNKAAARLFGYTQEEVAGRPLTLLMPARYRAAHERGVERLRSMGEARVIGKTLELHGVRKDGTEFPLELSLATWKTKEGSFFSGIIRDITARKQAEAALRDSEELFRQLAENIREVFWLSNPEKTRIIYVSPGYEDIWGRTCASLYASPRSWLDAIHPEDRNRVLTAATTKQVSGQYAEEYRIVRPDGSIRWILDRAFPIRDASGQVYRIAGIAEDITERKRAER